MISELFWIYRLQKFLKIHHNMVYDCWKCTTYHCNHRCRMSVDDCWVRWIIPVLEYLIDSEKTESLHIDWESLVLCFHESSFLWPHICLLATAAIYRARESVVVWVESQCSSSSYSSSHVLRIVNNCWWHHVFECDISHLVDLPFWCFSGTAPHVLSKLTR
jgi:hypothetical protein